MKSKIKNQKSKIAFTLIELLVVITIIVVLLALLAPALDQAIYQAELAQEGAGQRAIAQSMITYAANHKRHYPQTPTPRNANGYQPDLIGHGNNPNQDFRRVTAEYLTPKNHVCPLAPEALDFSHEGNAPDTYIFGNFYIFAGWRWEGPLGGRGMARIGDRLSFLDSRDFDPDTGQARRIASTVLVMDRHLTLDTGDSQSMHADKAGVLTSFVSQGGPFGVVVLAGVGVGGGTYTFTIWGGGDDQTPRGPVDFNYAFTDGSVSRILDVLHRDPRMANAPAHGHSDSAPEWKIQIPPTP